MVYYRFFLWENGAKSTEFTKYLTVPIFIEDKLNEELGTAEVILDAMQSTLKTPFAPKTKFRLERYYSQDYSDEPKVWDFVVDHDDVEDYAGCPDLCCHRIHLIEPSVIAQGMHVDNIALTYELQDVTLNYKTYSSDSTLLNDLVEVSNGGGHNAIKSPSDPTAAFSYGTAVMGGSITYKYNYFKNAYFYQWRNTSSLKALKLNLSSTEQTTISFTIPTLMCMGCPNESTFEDLFEMNTITKVYETKLLQGVAVGERSCILTKESGASSTTQASNTAYYTSGNSYYLRRIESYKNMGSASKKDCFANHYTSSSAIAHSSSDFADKLVEFTTATLTESEIDEGYGYLYEIECLANPDNTSAFIDFYNCCYVSYSDFYLAGLISYTKYYLYSTTNSTSVLDANLVCVKCSFNVKDLSNTAEYGYLIMKGKKYSCYQLLRKALLTLDTQIVDNSKIGVDDIEYPIILNQNPSTKENWVDRLNTAKVQETILENKNLWEVLLQIGYYLHAIPYLKFATDGTDRFMLSFKQLGDATKKDDENTKITVYNNQNLSEYFTQYDSYVTNIFSPQNEVEEWLVVKTDDDTCLVSNNTAVLKTTYGINEIVEFDITYDGSAGGEAGTESALSHIFEQSIYSILTADYNISPGMGDSLYYTLGEKEISGLTYVPPTESGDVMPMSLKRIVSKLFSNVNVKKLKFNNLQFHIKYRTQDSMRISQIRPDIQNFMQNSSYEKFPKHEQWYGQQDKIVDSERFSLNLFGKLVRVGNGVYQCQEIVNDLGLEKEAGDLIEIDGEPYYITEIENEYYPDAVLQKVTYSKNFNQLSQIVTIPSEPRFYEVSERSKITREVRLFDFFKISTQKHTDSKSPRFLSNSKWKSFLKKIIFNKESVTLPNYAWTRFQADLTRTHTGSQGQYVENSQLFPSSEIDRTDETQIVPKSASDHSDVIVPLLHFPMKDGIQFEWDMEDNFKAGDSIDTSISGEDDTVDDAYYALQSVRYCDVLGRADLFNFRLFNKTDWTQEQSQQLSKACITPTESESIAYLPIGESDNQKNYIALDKDCREALSFNYQICLLYTDDEYGNFVTFSNLFGTKTSKLYCCLLDSEVSMFNENTSVIPAEVLADDVTYELVEDDTNNQLTIQFTTPTGVDTSKIKSIVFYEKDDEGNKVSYLAKNFKNGITGDSIPNLYIYPVYND